MPSNLKWERRDHRRCCPCFRHIFWSYVAISMIILMTSSIIYYLRFQTQKAVSPFRQLRCERMFNQFDSDVHTAFEKTKMKLDDPYFKHIFSFNWSNDTYFNKLKRLMMENVFFKRDELYDLSLVSCYCNEVIKLNDLKK